MSQLTKKEIEEAIFYGVCPSQIISFPPFKCVFLIVDDLIIPPVVITEWLNFFGKTIYIEGITDSRLLLQELPSVVFQKFVEEYVKFYRKWANAILEYVPSIVEDSGSRLRWQIGKSTSFEKVIPVRNQLNMAQYYWAGFNVVKDTSEKTELISSVFDMLKPWLDKDLWKVLEEGKDELPTARVNRLYDQQVETFENDLDEIVSN